MTAFVLTKSIISVGLLLLTGFITPVAQRQAAAEQYAVTAKPVLQATGIEGAWQLTSTGRKDKLVAGNTAVRIMADGYFAVAIYNKEQKKFVGTYGGTYTLRNGQLTEKYEFNTFDSTRVGTEATVPFSLTNKILQLKGTGAEALTSSTWEKLGSGKTASPLAGAWRITERLGRDGQMSTMPTGARKTIKILSGNRFQWIAYNSETAVLSGTGGGTYTWNNGKYTETIEYFSRDSSRVGRQLTFDYDIRENNWHHSGLSSTGNSVNEVWQRLSGR